MGRPHRAKSATTVLVEGTEAWFPRSL